ncbi:MAG: serine/threonine protein kinase, partial [Bryobacteraceae bacterium]
PLHRLDITIYVRKAYMSIELPPIGQYALQQRLSRDSISEVWRAYDSDSRRMVLIKFFRTDLPHASASLASYVRDVEHVAALHHPNIVPIHDVHVLPSQSSTGSASLLCLATKYVEGADLADYIRSTSAAGKLPLAAEIVSIFTAIAQALDLAHRYGVIHGNLKPGNILFDQSNTEPGRPGTLLLADFGQTKFLSGRGSNDVPSYLSPEQIKGTPADQRSDIYALGVILYEIYTGVLPFQGKRPIAIMMQHVSAPPTPPDLVNPTISPALTQVILRCLAKNPQERFPNVASLVVALTEALRIPPANDLRRLAAGATPPPASAQSLPETPAPPFPRARRGGSKVITTIIALLLLLSMGLGTFLVLMQKNATVSTQEIGQAFFQNSVQLNGSSSQGLNDELKIDLSNVPDPAPGKSYYAWLLGDSSSTEESPILLGRLTVTRGSVHMLYAGDKQHANLLGFVSRFLITEDDAHNPTSDPLLNQSIWRYYAAVPQTPDPTDKLHFSMLDHLRHLLVESPELTTRG